MNQTPSEIEHAVLGIRGRLVAHATPKPRFVLAGAATIRQELAELGYTVVLHHERLGAPCNVPI